MTEILTKVKKSEKSAYQRVQLPGVDIGEIWREQVHVVVSKLTEPRRMSVKWRWFARRAGSSEAHGRGARAALLLGAGFKSKDEAIAVLTKADGGVMA